MEFPVELKLRLSRFPDGGAVLDLLRSHGFQLTGAAGDEVCCLGDFQQLRALKPRLESLSPSRPFVVDADVFHYTECLCRHRLDAVLRKHGVALTTEDVGDGVAVGLRGKGSNMAAGELRELFADLSQSLRTQEVSLSHARRHAQPLLDRIRQNQHRFGPVLVEEMADRLHLIGPSKESYELKQRLLGNHQSGRSSSLPPANRERGASAPQHVRGRSFTQPEKSKKKKFGKIFSLKKWKI